MKKLIGMLILILVIGYFSIVKRTTVDASEEAVIVKKPWFFGDKGLEKKPISTGTIWHVSSTEVKVFSLKAFNIKEHISKVLTEENIPIDFDLNFTFKYLAGKTPLLVETFGEDYEWYHRIVKEPLINTIEQASKKRRLSDLLNSAESRKDLEALILFGVKDLLNKQKIPVALLDVQINRVSPPQKVMDEAMSTALEKEKIQQEKSQIALEKLRQEREKARANADKAYMSTMGMSMREYMEMKRIELRSQQLANQKFAIERANDSNGTIQIHMNVEK